MSQQRFTRCDLRVTRGGGCGLWTLTKLLKWGTISGIRVIVAGSVRDVSSDT